MRLRIQRDQLGFQMVDLDSLLAPDHPARAVWVFVEALDLSELLASIKARAGGPRPPAGGSEDPDDAVAVCDDRGGGSARVLAEFVRRGARCLPLDSAVACR